MSIAAYKTVWEHSRSKGSNRLVLLCLAEHSDDNGRCWPGLKRLARLTNMSKRQVSRSLKTLDEMGEIQYTPGDGRGNKSHYQILLKDDRLSSYTQPVKDDKYGAKDDNLSERVTNETLKDDSLSSRTIIEPSKNRKEPVTTTVLARVAENGHGSAIVFYENNIGGLSPKISELIYAAIDDHTEQVVIEAMNEAVTNNVRRWNYIDAILTNWKQNGRVKPSANGYHKQPSRKPGGKITAADSYREVFGE